MAEPLPQYTTILTDAAQFHAEHKPNENVPADLAIRVTMVDFALGTGNTDPLSFTKVSIALTTPYAEPDTTLTRDAPLDWKERLRMYAATTIAEDLITVGQLDTADEFKVPAIPDVDPEDVLTGLADSIEQEGHTPHEIIYGTEEFRKLPTYALGIYLDEYEDHVDIDALAATDDWEADFRRVTENALQNAFSPNND